MLAVLRVRILPTLASLRVMPLRIETTKCGDAANERGRALCECFSSSDDHTLLTLWSG